MIIKNKPQKKSSLEPTHQKRNQTKNELAEKEVSAGGVVFRHASQGIQIAFMKDSYGKWTLPKGHVEHGEEIEEAAARETLEELGLEEIRFLEHLGKVSIWFRDRFNKKGKLIHKDIYFFLFETPVHAQLSPSEQERSYDAKWVPLKKVVETTGYADLVPVLKRAVEYLSEK